MFKGFLKKDLKLIFSVCDGNKTGGVSNENISFDTQKIKMQVRESKLQLSNDYVVYYYVSTILYIAVQVRWKFGVTQCSVTLLSLKISKKRKGESMESIVI